MGANVVRVDLNGRACLRGSCKRRRSCYEGLSIVERAEGIRAQVAHLRDCLAPNLDRPMLILVNLSEPLSRVSLRNRKTRGML